MAMRENMVVYCKVFLQNIKEYERLMPNEFLVKTIGRLNDEEGEARSIIQLDVNNDEYWNREKLLSQVKNTLLIFERTHPELDCCALYLLANQPDFLSEHELIQQEIEKRDHKVIIKIVLPHLANEKHILTTNQMLIL
ncbi:36934_t:CDS:2, partial [Gigaspora margarita]